MDEEEPQIICLNYCLQDPETGYCLTCGRPPIAVTGIDLNAKTFAGISLRGMTLTPRKTETPDKAS